MNARAQARFETRIPARSVFPLTSVLASRIANG